MSDIGEKQASDNPVVPHWLAIAWNEVRPRIIAIAAELMASVALLLVFAVFYLVTRLLVIVGVPIDFVARIEQVDRWAIFAVFTTFSVGFVGNAALGAYSQFTRMAKSVAERVQ